MQKDENTLVIERFKELKTERSKFITKWQDIQSYVAITHEINSEFETSENKAAQRDIEINDPTAFISTNQAGDYLAGIINTDLTLEASEEIKKSTGEDLSDFYKSATTILNEQINHPDAGYLTLLRSYAYDQYSFATSGIGAFVSKEFLQKQSECCLSLKGYGVWNSCVDEGVNNKITIVYTVYSWSLNTILDEFCHNDKGEFIADKLKDFPKDIQEAYDRRELNKKFKIVHAILPNNYYKLETRGIKGARFKGYWFVDNTDKVFSTEYYKEMPVCICRAIRVNGQVYGESSGSISISSTKMLNYVAGNAVDNVDKNTNVPLGTISGALINGNTFDASAGSVTQFNPKVMTETKQSPIFPVMTVGDISALISFLIPKCEKDIINIYKIDQLLDFNNKVPMTAYETLNRVGIRGKSLAGMIGQQKSELVEPLAHRIISIIQGCGLFGYIKEDLPETTEEEILIKQRIEEEGKIIPDAVAKAMKDGKRWYKLKLNGELEKLANAETYENLGKFLQIIQLIFALSPDTVNALKPYELLILTKEICNLTNEDITLNPYQFKDAMAKIQAQREEEQKIQMLLAQSGIAKNAASAQKDIQASGFTGSGGEYEQ